MITVVYIPLERLFDERSMFMLKIEVVVDADMEDATGIKEWICMALEGLGDAHVTMISKTNCNPWKRGEVMK